jgi:hypothetical protein
VAEYLKLGTAIIIEPLDAPLTGCFAILEYLGWCIHAEPLSPDAFAGNGSDRNALWVRMKSTNSGGTIRCRSVLALFRTGMSKLTAAISSVPGSGWLRSSPSAWTQALNGQ